MKMLCLILGVSMLQGCTPAPQEAAAIPFIVEAEPPRDDRESVLDVARGLVGTTEASGRNDGPVIEKIQKAAGIHRGDPYCAAFNYWCYNEAGLAAKVPRSGWSPSWLAGATWTQNGKGETPKPADAFGIWFPNKKRVAHTGLVEKWGDTSAVTLEGNTSPSAEFGAAHDRDGDGIWRKRRLIRQIHSVRDWIGE